MLLFVARQNEVLKPCPDSILRMINPPLDPVIDEGSAPTHGGCPPDPLALICAVPRRF
jgi:hypothetical protein